MILRFSDEFHQANILKFKQKESMHLEKKAGF